MKQLFQFVAAFAVAAFHQCRTQGRCLEKGKAFLRALQTSRCGKHPSAKARMEECRKCPLFYKPLQTCGSPLAKESKMGCYCYLPLKVTLKANCWLFDETNGELGWPKPLNDYEPKPEQS